MRQLTFNTNLWPQPRDGRPQNKMESSVLGSAVVNGCCCRGRLALRDVAAVKGRPIAVGAPRPSTPGWLLCSAVLSQSLQPASFLSYGLFSHGDRRDHESCGPALLQRSRRPRLCLAFGVGGVATRPDPPLFAATILHYSTLESSIEDLCVEVRKRSARESDSGGFGLPRPQIPDQT